MCVGGLSGESIRSNNLTRSMAGKLMHRAGLFPKSRSKQGYMVNDKIIKKIYNKNTNK